VLRCVVLCSVVLRCVELCCVLSCVVFRSVLYFVLRCDVVFWCYVVLFCVLIIKTKENRQNIKHLLNTKF